MQKFGSKIVSVLFVILLASALLVNAAEIGFVINDEPVVLVALGSAGDSGDSDTSGGSGGSTVTPTKYTNPISVKTKTVKIDYKKLYKKTQKIAKKNAFTVSNAKGTVSFAKKSGNSKITINKKGVITVKKGLKAGKYTLKVKVTASGNSSYKAGTKTVKVTSGRSPTSTISAIRFSF